MWPGLAELGVLGAAFDEAHGGFAGDPRSLALIQYELGRALAVEPYLACAVVAGRILQQSIDAAARQQAIGKLIEGSRIYVPAHDSGGNPFAAPLLAARHRRRPRPHHYRRQARQQSGMQMSRKNS